MNIGRSTTSTSEGYTVPRAPDELNKDSFKHKNRVLRPSKQVCFSIFVEVHYFDASPAEQAERFDSDEDLDIFRDEPVIDLSVFHRQ